MQKSSIIYISALIIAGEAIFSLPFLVQRVFKPTLLDVLGITNLDLGLAFSAYGVIALLCYLIGGPIADRFAPKKLMAGALLSTALGGVYYASFPSKLGLTLLFAYWGITTILTFWAPLIKATKVWGGQRSQGMAFGILDGGRGLFAALLGSTALYVFTLLLPEVGETTLEDKRVALRQAIYIVTGFTIFAAGVVWWGLPNDQIEAKTETEVKAESVTETVKVGSTTQKLMRVLSNPLVWLQGVIVITAYCCYKSVDNLGLFARDVLQYGDVEAARVSELSLWVRPFAALGIGILGDRIGALKGLMLCFSVLSISYLCIALGAVQPTRSWVLWFAVVETGVLVFGLRGLYFAILQQNQTPPELVGTAVGVISIIGYLPDIFMGSLMGGLNAAFPGEMGHRYIYVCLMLFCSMGFVATYLFQRKVVNRH